MSTTHRTLGRTELRAGTYRVRFTYLEPAYARARGIDVVPYSGAFDVRATDAEHAVVIATELFHHAQRSSGVAWAREIQTVSALLVED